jgi:hypothetical protein
MEDLDYLQAHVPGFAGYADEDARHETDRRVRAVVGTALADAQARLGDRLPADVATSLEALVFRCEFPDQKFVTAWDHADIDAAKVATLARIDRALVEQAESVSTAGPAEVAAVVSEVDLQFDHRDDPVPA